MNATSRSVRPLPAVVFSVVFLVVAGSAAGASAGAGVTPVLPAPSGWHAIGTVSLHLVDRSRPDPWVAPQKRELMISVWYPALPSGGDPPAVYMQPGDGPSAAHPEVVFVP